MSSMAYKRAHKRVLVIEEMGDELMLDHEEAQIACHAEEVVEEVLGEVVETMDLIKKFANRYQRGLHSDSTSQQIAGAHAAGFLLTKMMEQLQRIGDLADSVRSLGYSISRTIDLKILKHELGKIKAELARKWLLPDSETIERARRELEAGEYIVL